jgi:hypothetical protein
MSKTAEILARLERVEAAVAEIGHNGGPPLDEPPERAGGLLPDRKVAERYDVAVRTLERWDAIPDLGFPPPVYIRRRRYRVIAKLDEWDRRNARKVADPHNPHRAAAQPLPRAQRGRFVKAVEAR